MSDTLKEKVEIVRNLATSLENAIKTLNKEGVTILVNISTQQKTVDFILKDSDIPILDITIKATANQEL